MKFLPSLTTILLTASLAACGSSPPVRYYSLDSAVPGTTAEDQGAKVIGLGPFRFPDYLKRSQMVTRGAGAEIEVREFARWAEPVDRAMHRVVAAELDDRLRGVAVVAYPYIETAQVDFVVLGQVDRFESDASGRVLLQLQWSAVDSQHTTLITPRRASYEATASTPDDPAAIARAMNQALVRFSDDIATQLDSALQQAAGSD